jgi:hypothetical protein
MTKADALVRREEAFVNMKKRISSIINNNTTNY